MKIGIFYIATSVYKEYFKQYFLPSINNLFPGKDKELILISDGLEQYNDIRYNKVHITVEDIIDFPYPIINLCKFQIIEKYANKHNIDIVLYFDADTLIYTKELEFWENLLNKIETENDKMHMSYHPHYLYNAGEFFTSNLFFPYKEGSICNISEEEKQYLNEHKCYIMTSFFMCHIKALHYFTENIYEYAKFNLRELRWIPFYSDETYLNIINLRNPGHIILDRYVNINPYIYWGGSDKSTDNPYINNLPEHNALFVNQKFDIELKDQKR